MGAPAGQDASSVESASASSSAAMSVAVRWGRLNSLVQSRSRPRSRISIAPNAWSHAPGASTVTGLGDGQWRIIRRGCQLPRRRPWGSRHVGRGQGRRRRWRMVTHPVRFPVLGPFGPRPAPRTGGGPYDPCQAPLTSSRWGLDKRAYSGLPVPERPPVQARVGRTRIE